jgi:hypothetical protein
MISIVLFSLSAAIGTYFVFYLYARFFKLIEHKLTFIVKNINFWKESFGAHTLVQNFYEVETSNYELLDTILI